MDEVIAEHRVNAAVDDCYLVARQVAETQDFLMDFDGDLDEESGAFRRITCSIDVEGENGRVQVGSMDFLALAEDVALLTVYERWPADAEGENGLPDHAGHASPTFVRNVAGSVVARLSEMGFL